MTKQETLNFINQSKTQDDTISRLTEQKIQEFMIYQDSVSERLRNLMTDFFPDEIIELCKNYINSTHLVIKSDELWIDIYSSQIRARLNPNDTAKNIECFKISDLRYTPKNIHDLQRHIEIINEYVLLADLLEKNIYNIYNKLCEWKTTKYNKELELLNNISFPTQQAPKQYKVTITIEEV